MGLDRFDVALGLALFVGIVLTGQIVRLLAAGGFTALRYAVWILGYGGVVLAAWYVWIRPLDIHAPGTSDGDVWESDGSANDAPDSER